MSSAASTLALQGGRPVYEGKWPSWPNPAPDTVALLQDVALSGRWAISGAYTGRDTYEKRLSEAFSRFAEAPFVVPTANGTSALTIALEAAGVGFGAEVLVPGLTWVACASAAAALGARPVLVDIDPSTLAMSIEAAEASITSQTQAILLVHPYCMVADVEAFQDLARRHGVILIEDCSQAHGAAWRGKPVGTFGAAGAFSLQQTKLLTCGEGGLAITSEPVIYDKMQQLRADGRRYCANAVLGQLELEEVGSVQGRNFCLSEFQAAVALSQLGLVEEQNRLREANAVKVQNGLRGLRGVSIPQADPRVTRRSFYQFLIKFDRKVLGSYDAEKLVAAIAAETGVFCELIDTPLNANRLYNPLLSVRTPLDTTIRQALDPKRFELPNARLAQTSHVAFGHWALLGDDCHCEAIVAAVRKILDNFDVFLIDQTTGARRL